MAVNFPNSPNDGDVFSNNGIAFVYSNTHNAWSSSEGSYTDSSVDTHLNTSTASNTQVLSYTNGDYDWVDQGGGGVTTYATISARDAASPTAGDLGFVTANKALYMYDGTEWDRIAAGSDESPVITTEPPTSTQNLSNSGNTSTVQMVAQDPEGFGIEYGIAYNTSDGSLPLQLGSATSINQSTGVYTFTPTSNTVNSGSFKARLSASDGVKATTRLVDFSISFTDALDILGDGSCIALYKLNGNGDDVSGNYNATGYFAGSSSGFDSSIYKYDSSLDASSTALDLPDVRTSYPITVSAWMRPNNISAGFGHLLNMTMGASQRLVTGFAPYNSVYGLILAYGGSNHWYFTPNTAFVANTWYHIIFSIVGNNDSSHAVYINGSASVTPNNAGGSAGGSAGWALGGNASGAERFAGHIDHVRVFNKALSSSEAATLYSGGG